MADTVLIAAPQHLPVLTERSDFSEALTFPDSDALAALEAITRQPPKLVAVESVFAATPRGVALINRLQTDPALLSCEIRIVAHDTGQSEQLRSSTREIPGPKTNPVTAAETSNSVTAVETAVAASSGLDQHGTRSSQRFAMIEGLTVLLDGNPARLVDLSLCGAQVIASAMLKPNQRVRILLTSGGRARIGAAVQWANFEVPQGGKPCYRAGLKFIDADPQLIAGFIDTNKRV